MSRNRKKKIAAFAVLGVFAFSGGVAIAYYNAKIDVSGATAQATIAPNTASNIVATFASGQLSLVPGAPAQNLVLNLTNNNDYAVGVNAGALALDFANMTASPAACTPAKALLSANEVVLSGTGTVFKALETRPVTFAVQMENSLTEDQTVCAAATLTIPVIVK